MNSENNNNGYFMIKTFEDACNVLGNEDPLVEEYFRVSNLLSEDTQIVLKLRIISKALNNGWEPIFNEDELRYIILCTAWEMISLEKPGRLEG